MQLLCGSALLSNRERGQSRGKEIMTILDASGSSGSVFEGKCDVQSLHGMPGTVFPTSDFFVSSLYGHIHIIFYISVSKMKTRYIRSHL